MEIKWYWLAMRLGLVEDLSAVSANGETWAVSAKADEVFLAMRLGIFLLLLLGGFALGRFCASRTPMRIGVGILLTYALTLAVGIGPYIEFYPTGGGFFDLSVLEHILSGILCAAAACLFSLSGRLGRRIRTKCHPNKEKYPC